MEDKKNIEKLAPRVFGLILCGGQSTRMGNDKGLISYHGKPQRDYLYDLASQFCETVYYSARKDQLCSFSDSTKVIVDKNRYPGPFNGILSAHEAHEDVAWLILACDLPLLDEKGLLELVSNRNISKYATAFSSKDSGMPEPLLAIWEPQALVAAKQYLETGNDFGTRQFLTQSEIQLIVPHTEEQLYNANSMEDYKLVKQKLS